MLSSTQHSHPFSPSISLIPLFLVIYNNQKLQISPAKLRIIFTKQLYHYSSLKLHLRKWNFRLQFKFDSKNHRTQAIEQIKKFKDYYKIDCYYYFQRLMHTYSLMQQWQYRNAVNFSDTTPTCQLALYGNTNYSNFTNQNKNNYDSTQIHITNTPKIDPTPIVSYTNNNKDIQKNKKIKQDNYHNIATVQNTQSIHQKKDAIIINNNTSQNNHKNINNIQNQVKQKQTHQKIDVTNQILKVKVCKKQEINANIQQVNIQTDIQKEQVKIQTDKPKQQPSNQQLPQPPTSPKNQHIPIPKLSPSIKPQKQPPKKQNISNQLIPTPLIQTQKQQKLQQLNPPQQNQLNHVKLPLIQNLSIQPLNQIQLKQSHLQSNINKQLQPQHKSNNQQQCTLIQPIKNQTNNKKQKKQKLNKQLKSKSTKSTKLKKANKIQQINQQQSINKQSNNNIDQNQIISKIITKTKKIKKQNTPSQPISTSINQIKNNNESQNNIPPKKTNNKNQSHQQHPKNSLQKIDQQPPITKQMNVIDIQNSSNPSNIPTPNHLHFNFQYPTDINQLLSNRQLLKKILNFQIMLLNYN